ncbi:ABC transporter permease [Devosia sp. PTR5]|uniref:ABC transporter permease n=1 Tax=Devosia oryzisoli TaxID=2774138 RepID=A0A927ITK9_9HYPH|nr:ABC transporter permease [Devosia oryzisoli]MBD8065987.1 ABC transporter permease [Devosia oryzisoli]
MSAVTASATHAGPLRVLLQNRVVTLSIVVLGIFAIAAIFAPYLTPYQPNGLSMRERLLPPSSEHWAGTDELGRDIFTRLIYAGRVSLAVGLGVAALASVFGVVLGILAGFFSRLDPAISRLLDAMMAFPDVLLAIALLAAFGGSLLNLIIALAIVFTPRIARVVRASSLVVRELTYVEAARALGVSTPRILFHHVFRNITSPIIVQATFIFAAAMLSEAGLSFLGIGIDPSMPTWGVMISAGRQYIDTAGWLILFPGLAITICVVALQLTGDGLRDALDPRIRKSI